MTYLFAAYVAFWSLLFLYLFTLNSRQKKLEKTLETLLRQIEKVG